jgi:kinesin family protein 3/17
MLKDKSESVKVVMRCRPLTPKEMEEQRECIVNVDMDIGSIQVYNPQNIKELKSFTFDHTYDWRATQQLIFEQTALPILESIMEGYNGTIFAYGQTGTGKTYTMEGNDNETDKGIIPRSIDWIFNNIKNYPAQQFLVRVSFVEIYNEEVRDLLSKTKRQKLNVREKDKVFYVENVTVIQAENSNMTLDIMKAGRVNRATGATKMNPGSSRSHSIFSITVESSTLDEQGEAHYKVGKLNLVDLAGSERQSKTESTGERFIEATKINLSLTCLGSVINKLVSGKQQYIPYRDSKLTMLLQDSLGGNTKTVMIANVGPADYNYDETLNTLWYASRAKKIKNKPRINEDPKDALLRQYQEEIELMKKKLLAMGKADLVMQISGNSGVGKNIINEEKQIQKAIEDMENERRQFKAQSEAEINKIKEQKNKSEEEKKKLIEEIKKKNEENNIKKKEGEELLAKYKKIKGQMIKGDDTQKKVKEQEIEIRRQREELEIKKREEQRLKEIQEEKEKNTFDLKKKYDTKKQNIDDLNDKIGKIQAQLEAKTRENQENEEKFGEEEDQFRELLIRQEREVKRLDYIISKFVPEEEKERIVKCLEYSEKDGCYKINNKKALINNYKQNIDKIKKMKKMKLKDPKSPTIIEDTINLQLEKPDAFCIKFDYEPNKETVDSFKNVLYDDDKDIFYYDTERNIQTNSLRPEMLHVPASKKDGGMSSAKPKIMKNK